MKITQLHPFAPYYPHNARGIIIGSTPPWNFCTGYSCDINEGEINFYYGSLRNRFWYIMIKVFEPDSIRWPRTKENCKTFLKNHKLAIADILISFSRNGKSALDQDLSDFEFNFKLLKRLARPESQIKFIYFTSKEVYRLFISMIEMGNLQDINLTIREDGRDKTIIIQTDGGEEIQRLSGIILKSPSGRNPLKDDALVADYKEKFSPFIKS